MYFCKFDIPVLCANCIEYGIIIPLKITAEYRSVIRYRLEDIYFQLYGLMRLIIFIIIVIIICISLGEAFVFFFPFIIRVRELCFKHLKN